MRLIRRFVFGEADVAIDPREIRAGPARGVEAHIEFQCGGRESLEQAPERLNDGGLITLTVRVHPYFFVVAAELLEELKRFARDYRPCGRHGTSNCRKTSSFSPLSVHDSQRTSIVLRICAPVGQTFLSVILGLHEEIGRQAGMPVLPDWLLPRERLAASLK